MRDRNKTAKEIRERFGQMKDRLAHFHDLRRRKRKKGTAWAAKEAGLSLEEVCEALEEDNQEAMRMAAEAWDKLIEVRHALIAMRGNFNGADLEAVIKVIGDLVKTHPKHSGHT